MQKKLLMDKIDMEDNDSIKVSDPVEAYSPTMFDTVISYLHSSRMPVNRI